MIETDLLTDLSLRDKATFLGLYVGVRDEVDPVSWRTLVVKSRRILGSDKDPDKVAASISPEAMQYFASVLMQGTWLELLNDEFERDVSGKMPDGSSGPLDVLLLNGRHYPEPLLYCMARALKGQSVAVGNPVGSYTDKETRILFTKLNHDVEKLVIVASTQALYGGDYSLLSRVCRLARPEGIALKIKEIYVVYPMAGGSRGHRVGENFGVEVLEATVHPKTLSQALEDIVRNVHDEFGRDIKVSFITVDVHHEPSFRNVIEAYGFRFINVDSSPVLAQGLVNNMRARQDELGFGEEVYQRTHRFISCDAGAENRTQCLTESFLRLAQKEGVDVSSVELVYMHKKRNGGSVSRAWVSKVERWDLHDQGKITRTRIKKPSLKQPIEGSSEAHFSDDMVDSGSTMNRDVGRVDRYYPGIVYKDVAATHAVLSSGVGVLDKIGVDDFIFTNTLNPEGLRNRPNVLVMDVSGPVIKEFGY